MAVVLRRVSSNAAAHSKLLEDRAPLSEKLGGLNADESSLDQVQAEPFFVRHLALWVGLRIAQAITDEMERSGP
jgi:hypothetical protein